MLSVSRAACRENVHKAVTWLCAQVAEFQASTAAFLARLHEHGPGTHAANLPAGLEALRHYQEQMESMVKQREQLALAEHLFDLGQTSYPELSKARWQQGLYSEHSLACCLRRFVARLDAGMHCAGRQKAS